MSTRKLMNQLMGNSTMGGVAMEVLKDNQKAYNKDWKTIKDIGWNQNGNHKAISKRWFSRLGIPEMNRLRLFVSHRVDDLYRAVDKWETENGRSLDIGSDDGRNDLLHHVVGLGKREFDVAMKDPRKLEDRYASGHYKESFAYVFHVPEPDLSPDQLRAEEFKRIMELAGHINDALTSVQKDMDLLNRKLRLYNL